MLSVNGQLFDGSRSTRLGIEAEHGIVNVPDRLSLLGRGQINEEMGIAPSPATAAD